MAFTFETKLHVLLIMTIIGISLYMYLLYKEVKIFQDDLMLLKQQLLQQQQILQIQQQQQQQQPTVKKVEAKILKQEVHTKEIIEDDDISVTSNEIKDMLTNIQETAETEETPEIVEIVETVTVPVVEEYDIFSMSEEELLAMKYEVLRKLMQQNKLNPKGTKQDFIKRINEIKLNKQV